MMMMPTAAFADPAQTITTNAYRAFKTSELLRLALGFVGIQFAWSIQIALSHQVLEPLGASPFLFGVVWCAGPVSGLLVQPIVGALSDKCWTPIGRRKPFIWGGTLVAALGLLLLPHSPTLWLAALMTLLLDVAINTIQGPYRALVPDQVDPKQAGIANSFINFGFTFGAVLSLGLAPLLGLFGVALDTSAQYLLASIAIVLFTALGLSHIKEQPKPADVAERQTGVRQSVGLSQGLGVLAGSVTTYLKANREIHKLSAVQFFNWMGLMCLFIYLSPFVIHHIYQLPDGSTPVYLKQKQLYAVASQIEDATLDNDKLLPAIETTVHQVATTRDGWVLPTQNDVQGVMRQLDAQLAVILPAKDAKIVPVTLKTLAEDKALSQQVSPEERLIDLKLSVLEYALFVKNQYADQPADQSTNPLNERPVAVAAQKKTAQKTPLPLATEQEASPVEVVQDAIVSQGESDASTYFTQDIIDTLDQQAFFADEEAKASQTAQLGFLIFNVVAFFLTVSFGV
jgi:MFS family permease